MLTVGVDLAAEASRTAVARVAWPAGGAVLEEVEAGADDAAIVGHRHMRRQQGRRALRDHLGTLLELTG